MKRPDFLVIGAQKCATTWLYQCLREHPELFVPSWKRDAHPLGSRRYEREGVEHYFLPFARAREGQVIVDASVSYLYNPRCAEAVHRHIPDCRFVAMLRNPIDRAVSAYRWDLRIGRIPKLPLEEGMRQVIAHYYAPSDVGWKEHYDDMMRRGFYDEQIRRFLRYFELDRFLFVLYETVEADPRRVIAEAYGFLGVAGSYEPRSIAARPKVGTYAGPVAFVERMAHRLWGGKRTIAGRAVGKGMDVLNQFLLKCGLSGRGPELSVGLRDELRRIYYPHMKALQEILREARVVDKALVADLAERWR